MRSFCLIILALLVFAGTAPVYAQSRSSAKMYCWQNKSGKTECGDKVPYEYQDGSVRELNKQGVVTRRTEASSPEERRAREEAQARKRVEEQKELALRRQDKVLTDTFSNEKEIDLKRQRELQLMDVTIESLENNLKNLSERQAYIRGRTDQYLKDKKPIPATVQEDLDRLAGEKLQIERLVAQKRREISALNQHYDELKKRYAELTGTSSVSTPRGAASK